MEYIVSILFIILGLIFICFVGFGILYLIVNRFKKVLTKNPNSRISQYAKTHPELFIFELYLLTCLLICIPYINEFLVFMAFWDFCRIIRNPELPQVNTNRQNPNSRITRQYYMSDLIFAYGDYYTGNAKHNRIKQTTLENQWCTLKYSSRYSRITCVSKEIINGKVEAFDAILQNQRCRGIWQSCLNYYNKSTQYTELKETFRNYTNITEYTIDAKYTGQTVLENHWCKIIYDFKNDTITCEDKQIRNGQRKTFVARKFSSPSCYKTWEYLITNYNKDSKFPQIREFLRKLAILDENSIKVPDTDKTQEKISFWKRVDVNHANEDELCILPGINRIQAKKIIQFRERDRYFNSRDDFFETMQIKEHFRKQMKFIVVANPSRETHNKNLLKDKERKVDL